MEQAYSTIRNDISNCTTPTECYQIQQRLRDLLNLVEEKLSRDLLKLVEEKPSSSEETETEGLNYQGKDAVVCHACKENTIDPNGEFANTCESCNLVTCTECVAWCNLCEATLCVEECARFCDFCEENVCLKCTVECQSACGCGSIVCKECTRPDGSCPGWDRRY